MEKVSKAAMMEKANPGPIEKKVSQDVNLVVDWDSPNDPARPFNWSFARKWAIVISTSLATFMVSFNSSVYSGAIPKLKTEFHVSNNVALLGIAVYVLGFAFGPMVWGPASELYGKTRPLWAGSVLFCLFQIPFAVARNMPTILVFRFLAGLAGSSYLAIIGGMFVDFLITPTERGVSTAIFSLATFCGPAAGPIVGNLATEHLGWRWVAWITLIGGGIFGLLSFLLTNETSEAVVLRWKAQRLRRETGDNSIRAKGEQEQPSMSVFVTKYLSKPVKMVVHEPILIAFTIYMALAYGIIYLSFTIYPHAFVVIRGWSPVTGSLPFLGIFVGIAIACTLLGVHSIYYVGPLFNKTHQHVPERRLLPMILGSVLLPGGIFWFAWTSDPKISWVPQVLSGLLIGSGSILIFMSGVVYLIEVYLVHANSALAINNFLRSSFAAAFPFFATDLFTKLGMGIGGSVLGAICIALIPFPLVFWKYGHIIRSWSSFASH